MPQANEFSREFRGLLRVNPDFSATFHLNSLENLKADLLLSSKGDGGVNRFSCCKIAMCPLTEHKILSPSCHPPVTLCHPLTGCKPFVAGRSVTLSPFLKIFHVEAIAYPGRYSRSLASKASPLSPSAEKPK